MHRIAAMFAFGLARSPFLALRKLLGHHLLSHDIFRALYAGRSPPAHCSTLPARPVSIHIASSVACSHLSARLPLGVMRCSR